MAGNEAVCGLHPGTKGPGVAVVAAVPLILPA